MPDIRSGRGLEHHRARYGILSDFALRLVKIADSALHLYASHDGAASTSLCNTFLKKGFAISSETSVFISVSKSRRSMRSTTGRPQPRWNPSASSLPFCSPSKLDSSIQLGAEFVPSEGPAAAVRSFGLVIERTALLTPCSGFPFLKKRLSLLRNWKNS